MNDICIFPAVLAKTEEELKLQLDKIAPLTDHLHIDFADGQFVESQTVDWQVLLDLPEYYLNHTLELHVMAKDPLPIAKAALEVGYIKVIIPIEELSANDMEEVLTLGGQGDIFVSINPETEIDPGNKIFDAVVGVVVMTVKPGAQGQTFEPDALDKIAELKENGFDGAIEVDGGINEKTIKEGISAGATLFAVGSAIINSDEPKKVYDNLLKQAD